MKNSGGSIAEAVVNFCEDFKEFCALPRVVFKGDKWVLCNESAVYKPHRHGYQELCRMTYGEPSKSEKDKAK